MSTSTVENMVIESADILREDHGILTAAIALQGAGFSVTFGGYAFDAYHAESKTRKGTAFGMDFIARVLSVVGVDSLSRLKGSPIRAQFHNGAIVAIGHFIEDRWFYPANLAREHES